MKELIKFSHVTKEYPAGDDVVVAVNDVSFTIHEGEFAVVLGPSGAGKSTVLNLLGGMDTVTKGSILVDGKDITSYRDKELTSYRGTEVGFIFQFYNLIPSLTVIENVSLVKEVALEALDAGKVLNMVGLSHRLYQFPAQISGGEQQRVSIARAVAKNPKLLLCDEPTGALDSETGVMILKLLQQMSQEYGRTVIVVTHNAVIAEAADHVICFRDGEVVKEYHNENPINVEDIVW